MGLGAQVVDPVEVDLLDQRDQPGGIGEVAQEQPRVRVVRVLVEVEVVDQLGAERRRTPAQLVELIALGANIAQITDLVVTLFGP